MTGSWDCTIRLWLKPKQYSGRGVARSPGEVLGPGHLDGFGVEEEDDIGAPFMSSFEKDFPLQQPDFLTVVRYILQSLLLSHSRCNCSFCCQNVQLSCSKLLIAAMAMQDYGQLWKSLALMEQYEKQSTSTWDPDTENNASAPVGITPVAIDSQLEDMNKKMLREIRGLSKGGDDASRMQRRKRLTSMAQRNNRKSVMQGLSKRGKE